MGKVITINKLQVIKESSMIYDIESKKVNHPLDALNIIKKVFDMDSQPEEIMAMLVLNTKNVVIATYEICRGSLSSSIVHPREVFKRAIASNGAHIIIAHNHPSGDPEPSQEDISITKRLYECGKLLGIDLLDHLIIGEDVHVSLKEKGII